MIALVAEEYSRRNLPAFSDLRWHWFDDDDVETENVWTQGFKAEDADLCSKKVDTLIADFPRLPIVDASPTRIETEAQIMKLKPWAVMIACDNLPTRRMVYEVCNKHGVYFVDGRVNGNNIMVLDPSVPLAERAELLEGGADDAPTSCLYKWEKEQRIVHTTPLVTASIMIQFMLNYLRKEHNTMVDMVV